MVDQKIIRQNIITALGLTKLPDERKVQLLDKMAELAEKRISLRLMQTLSEQDHKEFEKISGQNDEVKMQFLQKKVPNLVEIIQDEVVKVKKEMIDEVHEADVEINK